MKTERRKPGNWSRAALGELAEVRPGVFLAVAPDGEVACLQASDFDGAGRLRGEVRRAHAASVRQARHLLVGGEVLVVAKGAQFRAVLAPEDVLPAVAGTSFHVVALQPDGVLLPAYLAWWLNGREAQASLNAEAVGTDIRSVPRDALADLVVPLPPKGLQREVVAAQAAADRLRLLRMELADAEHLLHSAQLIQMIKH